MGRADELEALSWVLLPVYSETQLPHISREGCLQNPPAPPDAQPKATNVPLEVHAQPL